jgi:4'-phosphopantetheinyl transferase EntD
MPSQADRHVHVDPQRALDALAPPGILIGHRIIQDGDENALLDDETEAFAGSVIKVRRASGAARIVARSLMERLGRTPQPIMKGAGGAPIWPAGLVGSLAHNSEIAVAALAEAGRFRSIGIDIEATEPLDLDLIELVATPRERERLAAPLDGRLLFAVKEAVYKAAYPLDGRFLDHHDVEVGFDPEVATIRGGRELRFRYTLFPYIVVLAYA